MHGLEKGKADDDILNGGFINESLTEMLNQQMYPNSNAYDAQVAMQKYANLLSGKINNFSRFLQGFIDARYPSHDWENYRRYTNAFQADFRREGYISLKEATGNSNYVNAQRKLISLFIKPTGNKNISEYIDAINKLLDRPVADTDYINDEVISALDKALIASLSLKDKILNDFLQKKLVELRALIVESHKNKEPSLCELEFEGMKITIQRQFCTETGEMVFMLNNRKQSINLDDTDFNERENRINSQIERLSSYFKKESSQDLLMISEATKQQRNLTKLEKFTLPNVARIGTKIYVATYENEIVILGDFTQIGDIENIKQSRYIGVTSQNPKVAIINYESIGNIDKGLLFSTLNSIIIKDKSIEEYCRQLEAKLTPAMINRAVEIYKNSSYFVEESEGEIRYEAVRKIAELSFDKLSEKEKNKIIAKVYIQNPRFVLSTKNGKVEASIMFGAKTAFKGDSELLYDKKGNGMYNEVFESIAKCVTSDMLSEKNSIPLDENGDIVYRNMKKEMDSLRAQYEIITNLIRQNQQYDTLVEQRDSTNEGIYATSSPSNTCKRL